MSAKNPEAELHEALHSLSGGAVAMKLRAYIKAELATAMDVIATEGDVQRIHRLQGRLLLLKRLEQLAAEPNKP